MNGAKRLVHGGVRMTGPIGICLSLFFTVSLLGAVYPLKLGDLDTDGLPTILDLAAIVDHMDGTVHLFERDVGLRRR